MRKTDEFLRAAIITANVCWAGAFGCLFMAAYYLLPFLWSKAYGS